MTKEDRRDGPVVICHPAEIPPSRAEALRDALPTGAMRRAACILATGAAPTGPVAALRPAAVVATGYGPDGLDAFAPLAAPVLWDMAGIEGAAVERWLADEAMAAALSRAMATVRSVVEVAPDAARAIEDALLVGLTRHDLPRALDGVLDGGAAVVIGAGLGNMIYATPMLRWLSERRGAPIDLIVNEPFPAAVPLFAGAPWLNVVHNGFGRLGGRRYGLLVSAVTAGAWTPPFAADRTVALSQAYSYNEEGRFVPEPQLNMLGMDAAAGFLPGLTEVLPEPFIRDIAWTPRGGRVVGVAHGQKSAAWAKREWGGMPELVARLVSEGWEVRSFGLPDEYVDGAEDYTGRPMREVVETVAECDWFISHDGGLCHIPEALGIPTLWLFGSTGSVKNGPVRARSRTLLSWRECGPCLYKIDWPRCDRPACMADLGVEAVHDAFAEMRAAFEAERRGEAVPVMRTEALVPRPLPERLLSYEVDAPLRASPDWLQPRAVAERMAALPRSAEGLRAAVLRMLAVGEPVGFATLAAAAVDLHPDDPALLYLADIAAHLHPGPVPVRPAGVAGPAFDMAGLEAALSGLAATEPDAEGRRTVLFTGLRHAILRAETGTAPAGTPARLLRGVLARPALVRDDLRNVQRLLERFSMERTGGMRDIQLRQIPSLARARARALASPAAILAERAAEMAAATGDAADRVLADGLVPHLRALGRTRDREIGGLPAPLAGLRPGDDLIVLTPHLRVKHGMAGSTSPTILSHLDRLATLGLRTVVMTTGYDDVPRPVATRDSTLFVQAHRDWTAAQWDEALAPFAAAAPILAYLGADRRIALGDGPRARVTRVELAGLWDAFGTLYEAPPSQHWDFGTVASPDDGVPRLAADALTAALLTPEGEARGTPPAVAEILTVVPDARDWSAFLRLVAAVPEVRFTVQTPFLHRGIESNLHIVPPAQLDPGMAGETMAWMQFSARPASLCASMVGRVEHDGQVIAAPDLSAAPALADRLATVAEPAALTAWIDAIRRVARRAAGQAA